MQLDPLRVKPIAQLEQVEKVEQAVHSGLHVRHDCKVLFKKKPVGHEGPEIQVRLFYNK